MAAMKGKREVTSIYMNPETLEKLRALAAHFDVPVAQLFREAVDDLLVKYAKELRRAKK